MPSMAQRIDRRVENVLAFMKQYPEHKHIVMCGMIQTVNGLQYLLRERKVKCLLATDTADARLNVLQEFENDQLDVLLGRYTFFHGFRLKGPANIAMSSTCLLSPSMKTQALVRIDQESTIVKSFVHDIETRPESHWEY